MKVLRERLAEQHDVVTVNLSKQHGSGFSIRRLWTLIARLWSIWKLQSSCDVVYLTIAESTAGNLRDLLIYWICRRRLSSVILHMFGGAGMAKILAERGRRFRCNQYFLQRIGSILVEGETQRTMFAKVTAKERIHVSHNFAEDFLFASPDEVYRKFEQPLPVQILFLSNMLYGKGHWELLQAFHLLTPEQKKNIHLVFAGNLLAHKDEFMDLLRVESQVEYLGPVFGERKRELYLRSHVFCLPTYYPFEGQPFCIVEAYATGCCVLTTRHSGIPDIFTDPANGLFVEKRSVPDLTRVLADLPNQVTRIADIGRANLTLAYQRHTQRAFLHRMEQAFQLPHHRDRQTSTVGWNEHAADSWAA